MYKVVSFYHEDQIAIADFRKTSNNLFSEYHYYLRNLVLSILNNTGDGQAIIERLNDNQYAIADMLTPYYPATKIATLVDLLKTQVSIIEQHVKAMVAKQDIAPVQALWVANTNEIATLLSSMDSSRWDKNSTITYFTQNANFIHRQVVARMGSDWSADIIAQDLAFNNICDLSDFFGGGVIMSNLDKFSK